MNQKVVLRMLERLGYRADVAANGLEVLEAMKRQPYDVILMDIQMPEMDGLEAARRIFQRRDRHEAPRLIAMTANAMPGDRELALSVGMEGYLTKPIDLSTLRQALLGLRTQGELNGQAAMQSLDIHRLDELAAFDAGDGGRLVRELIDLFIADSPAHMRNLWTSFGGRDASRASAHRFSSSVEHSAPAGWRSYAPNSSGAARRTTSSMRSRS